MNLLASVVANIFSTLANSPLDSRSMPPPPLLTAAFSFAASPDGFFLVRFLLDTEEERSTVKFNEMKSERSSSLSVVGEGAERQKQCDYLTYLDDASVVSSLCVSGPAEGPGTSAAKSA